MSTVFIGGSRHVSRLPAEVRQRLDNVVAGGLSVVVGDANGADKAVQKHFCDVRYEKVTVFCSGHTPRNNLGAWHTHCVEATKSSGFHFYAAKDREMAREADFGLMIWDGKSPGTMLNVLRLAIAGKVAVLFDVPAGRVENIKTVDQFKALVFQRSSEFRADLKARATADEWQAVEGAAQPSFLPLSDASVQLAAKDLIERLDHVQGAPRITSGSSADVQLQPPQKLTDLRTISAITSLARRGVHLPLAKASLEAMIHDPAHPVSVHVPHVEGQVEFAAEMAANGVSVVFLAPHDAATSRSDR